MVNIQDVIGVTAKHYGFTVGELLSENREQPLAFARQIAMRLSRDLTPLSYPEIGKAFANRDHTTIIHGCRKVAAKIGSDSTFEAEYWGLVSKVVLSKAASPIKDEPSPISVKVYRTGSYRKSCRKFKRSHH